MDGLERVEVHSFEPDEVTKYLQAAIDTVAAVDVPSDLRVAAFEQTLRMLSAKQVVLVQRDSPVALPTGPLRAH